MKYKINVSLFSENYIEVEADSHEEARRLAYNEKYNIMSEQFKNIGVSLTDDNGEYRNLSDILEDMSKKFNENIKNDKLEGENKMNKSTIEMDVLPLGAEDTGESITGTMKQVNNKMTLQVRYIDKNITPMEKIDGGDLVDIRVSRVFKNGEETIFPCKYSFGDTLFFKLGFAMKMPPNKKSNVYPRSGMFKNYGFLLTNSVGQIDNRFQGNDDEWCAMVWCTRDGVINYDDRILQFEVVDRVMENVEFEIVEQLGDVNRGGYSSTGTK